MECTFKFYENFLRDNAGVLNFAERFVRSLLYVEFSYIIDLMTMLLEVLS